MSQHLRTALPVAALLLPIACWTLVAGDTRTWSQSDYSEFEKGVAKKISLRSDGLLTLAPKSRELYDTASPYLWSVVRDSKGNLYAGGGTNAKLFQIAPDGKGKVLAELDALEVHAVAIDSHDRVYFATSPDGKVYRLGADGKPEVFYDPKSKYIWALLFDSKGDLFVATGDHGEIHRVSPDGKGQVFFQTDETHVRSLAFDAAGNLIAGTDPGGLVIRISPAGAGFVLYQLSKREVTSVAVARDGAIYAAGVGNKLAGGAVTPPPSAAPAPPPATVTAPGAAPAAAAQNARPAATPVSSGTTGVPGGSEVYRIDPDGNPRRVWSNSQEVVYAIAFDQTGHPVLATGNKGNIYRIDSPIMYTSLLSVPVAQVTALVSDAAGHLYAATGNVGKLYQIGPESEPEGSLESDVFDSAMYSLWGRLTFEGKANGGQISIVTRSGNLDQPQKNWSPWSTHPVTATTGARIDSPGARFVQWKATLTASATGKSPELESVDLAYLSRNLEPHVDTIEITPPNYKFPASSSAPSSSGLASTMNLPPLSRHQSQAAPSVPSEPVTATPTMLLAKGYIGARWLAADPNGDSMIYTVEIRGEKETEWKLLKDKVAEKYLTWDSTAFPDGDYRLRVTVSDSPSNPPAEALTSRTESVSFTIDNTPPRITNLTAARNGAKLRVRFHAADALNNIDRAEYSLDGGEWLVAAPVTHLSDSMDLDYDLSLDAGAGEHTIAVRVYDAYENSATDKAVVK